MTRSPVPTLHAGLLDPELPGLASYALLSHALAVKPGRMQGPTGQGVSYRARPIAVRFGMGQADHPAPAPMPAFVGASVNEHGQAYYHVLEEQRGAVAFALNNYDVSGTSSLSTPDGVGVIIAATRHGRASAGDLVPTIQAGSERYGVALIGDPFVDGKVTVLLGDSMPLLSRLAASTVPEGAAAPAWYVLSAPPQGWAARPTADQAEIIGILGQMARGLRWGAIAGGLVGLGAIVLYARKKRST